MPGLPEVTRNIARPLVPVSLGTRLGFLGFWEVTSQIFSQVYPQDQIKHVKVSLSLAAKQAN